MGRVRPALLQELQKQPWCTHEGCQACAGSDYHQTHHEDGRFDKKRIEAKIFICHPASTGTAGNHVQEEEPSSRRSHREHSSAACSPYRPWQSQGKNRVRGEDKHQPAGWICQG